ncbi:hypothetical protein JIN86_18305 [Lysinibacillus sp. HST-98]|uniref:hypothetical protein n=1 Tax=Lysinibacillus sp. HST-98 TaxID=2800419 RepID=UPI001927AB6F|nr:hypothetical protein [Lysinibacillus sp. HST-98]MBL3731544.1 hypothetical protein [Lysinibacillus sp. HST-98]
MAILNPIASNWSRSEREKLNNNWTIIERYLSNLQGQINLLTGDVDVQALIDQINEILNQGNVIIDDLETALQDATTIITNAENATTDANNAAQDALNAINDMQAFINQFGNAESYDNSKLYKVNNLVEYDGSGFICIKDTQGNPPPTLSIKRNEWWQLFAQKGLDGTGSVSKVAGKSPEADGNVPLVPEDIGAASHTDFNGHMAQSVEDLNGVHGLTIETGDFTPYFYGTTNAGTNTTYLLQTGTYYKINNLVKIDLTLQINNKDTSMSGDLEIGGIPFAASAAHCSIGGYQFITLSEGYSELLASITGTRIILKECGNNKAENDIVAAKIINASFIRLSATYKVSK